MKVICAWCEHEGKETLIGEIGLYDLEVTSHGICIDHEKGLLRQINELKHRQTPRLRRTRRPGVPPRASGSPGLPNCNSPWRRRRQHRLSPAQLHLPFADDEPHPLSVEQELQLAASEAGSPESTT